MRTILITMDSLNRHFLPLHGGEAETPCIDSVARDGIVFNSHFTASAPCIPARRELLTGTLEFRHRGWGPMEPFDNSLPKRLAQIGCPSMLITDHYHYFETGGENYHVDFTGFEFIRGQESDNWRTTDVEMPPMNPLSRGTPANFRSRQTYQTLDDFPVAKTFAKAIDWIGQNTDTKDFFVYIDEFDPHEPFVVPDEYLQQYDDSGYEGPLLDWPTYGRWHGNDQELRHLRNRYRAKVRMTDDCLGRFVDALKRAGMYDDTNLILTTDHGHFLGDHGYVGKPSCDAYNTLFHIPLIIKPAKSLGLAARGRRISALTSLPDLFATICDLHGIHVDETMYGRSLLGLITGQEKKVRNYVLYGYYGRQVGYCDGRYTYLKAPPERGDAPLYYFSTRLATHRAWTGQLIDQYVHAHDITIGPFIPETDVPVMRFRLDQGLAQVDWDNLSLEVMYDFVNDRAQLTPIHDPELLRAYRCKLTEAMDIERFPENAFSRLELTPCEITTH